MSAMKKHGNPEAPWCPLEVAGVTAADCTLPDREEAFTAPVMRRFTGAYEINQVSFVPGLLPGEALRLSTGEVLRILRSRLGERALAAALDPLYTDPGVPPDPRSIPGEIRSPAAGRTDGEWLKRSNIVGVNGRVCTGLPRYGSPGEGAAVEILRPTGSLWNVVKYALTLPEAQDAVHILPIWEPGVAGSIYGMTSWELNPELFSRELLEAVPHLCTTGRQLRAAINVLHCMGKTVGIDVLPHTDRYSEMVLAFPRHFEWLRREDRKIADHRTSLFEEVQQVIHGFVMDRGAAVEGERPAESPEVFFSSGFEEARRLRILFGLPGEHEKRLGRRIELIRLLAGQGYETVPATMAPPFRGLAVDCREEAGDFDEVTGLHWRDFVVQKPTPMSRVFGPLTRYRLYECRDDNRNWELDLEAPCTEVWEYVCRRYGEVQQRYGFDFMRGDMAHVQVQEDGVPRAWSDRERRTYDLLGTVKLHIRSACGAPHFAYLAESFLHGRGHFGYSEEIDHLEACQAETALGDLQAAPVGSPDFLRRLRLYDGWREARACTPCITVMTSDKDDPRFDEYYRAGNALRLFISLFVTDMPGYMGSGFESRHVHHAPAPNEHYTKLYVFHMDRGPKATCGPYIWGTNMALFREVTRLRLYGEAVLPRIRQRGTRWLIHPDPAGENPVIAWTQQAEESAAPPADLFLANTGAAKRAERFAVPVIPGIDPGQRVLLDFSTAWEVAGDDRELQFNGFHYRVASLEPGEGRIYRLAGREA